MATGRVRADLRHRCAVEARSLVRQPQGSKPPGSTGRLRRPVPRSGHRTSATAHRGCVCSDRGGSNSCCSESARSPTASEHTSHRRVGIRHGRRLSRGISIRSAEFWPGNRAPDLASTSAVIGAATDAGAGVARTRVTRSPRPICPVCCRAFCTHQRRCRQIWRAARRRFPDYTGQSARRKDQTAWQDAERCESIPLHGFRSSVCWGHTPARMLRRPQTPRNDRPAGEHAKVLNAP